MSESEPAEELAALKESKLTETEKPPARISAMAFVPHKSAFHQSVRRECNNT